MIEVSKSLEKKITKWFNENIVPFDKDLKETKKVHKEYEESPLFPFLMYEVGRFYNRFNGEGQSIEEWLGEWYFNEDFFAIHAAFADLCYKTYPSCEQRRKWGI